MIKTIISDLGNVIIKADNAILANNLSKHSKKSPEEIENQLFWSDLDIAYHEGRISSEEFYKKVTDLFGLSLTFEEFKQVYSSSLFDVNKELLDFFGNIKDKYKLLLLSDTNEIDINFVKNKYSFFEIFDDLILSFEVGLSKNRQPKEIFSEVVKQAGCLPEECVFIDDMEEYVKEARVNGLKAIHYTNMENLLRDFEKLGVK